MRLSLRVQKLAISAATGGCLVAMAVVALWAGRVPHVSASMGPSPTTIGSPAVESALDDWKLPAREAFTKLWDLPLRRPLYDPPPPKPEVRRPPPLQVELLGTILEAENSMAIVRSAQGGVEYKRVGEVIGPPDSPATVVEIHGDAVILDRNQERITLAVRGQEQRR